MRFFCGLCRKERYPWELVGVQGRAVCFACLVPVSRNLGELAQDMADAFELRTEGALSVPDCVELGSD